MTRWYRAYEGTVTDAKLGEVALVAECSRSVAIAAWHAILESCATVNDGGRFDVTPRRVAVILCEPVKTIEIIFAELCTIEMIRGSVVLAWAKRQFESDSSTERSRKHRETKRNGDATLQQRDATPPETDTETYPETIPPISLDAARSEKEGREKFEKFWKAMPNPDQAAKPEASIEFVKLTDVDQDAAIAGAVAYAEVWRKKPTTHSRSPAKFLRERQFDGFTPASITAQTVFITPEMPQWAAWVRHKGSSPPVNGAGGWYFPTEWPPGAEKALGAG